ncbi:gamma-glutamylcyclotransferase family protein [Nannocystis punicea]|uniref:Gamma-glutamylcyclotransferase n=1 Tax=Nannocystis punicea TaxID=2995304 RepID=A0ABY7GUY6_9BACT|nr:gamma-glutamylcyclotransferase family protein [Nannocystis poenicansa]WAS90779.1 gamma-glutamylcyclotransferase [Nannocystis poenicansa]
MVKPVVVDATSRSSGDVWYFAYGSNLHPQRRASRAGLSPLDSAPGTLCGWRLVFDMPGVPPADPAMASIRRDANGEVHGLLLRLRSHDFAALVRSEGGDRFYVREQVEVIAYDDRRVIAEVFIAAPGRRLARERPPSRRYLDLIREGARLSALRPEYCAWLEALPHAEASPAARWASDVFLEVFMRASRGRLRGLAQGWLDALQHTEELGALPRRVAQGVLLAPVLGVGLGLRALNVGAKR